MRYFYGECLSPGFFSSRCYLDSPEPSIQDSAVVEAEDPVEGMAKLRKRFDFYKSVTVVNFKEIAQPQ